MKKTATILAGIIFLGALGTVTQAAVPAQFSMQGKLTDAAGAPLPAGPKTFWLRIFDAAVDGTQLWTEGQVVNSDADGLWIVNVGASNPFTAQVFADSVRWLEIEVEYEANPPEILPRIRLISTPYSMRVGSIDGSTGGVVTGSVITGQGHTVSGAEVFVAGKQNTINGDQTTIAGGAGNSATGLSAFIGGGIENVADGEGAVVAGGKYNVAGSFDAAVLGGRYNEAGDAAVVAGGLSNHALGVQSTAGGGHGNFATAIGAVVGGGFWNKARGEYSVVCGGGRYDPQDSNLALGPLSFVGGGGLNFATGEHSAIVGGEGNQATGVGSMVGGGYQNLATGGSSTIAGGSGNLSPGVAACVPGGVGNIASGLASMAAGSYAIATYDHSFVWGDGDSDAEETNANFPNQFKISASNGVRIDKSAGDLKTIQLGDHYRDNGIVAWAKVRSDGLVSTYEFGVDSVGRNSAGNYLIVLDVSAASASVVVATVTPEMSAAPTSAATLRVASMRQISASSFEVYINTGAGIAVDNDFVFMATAR